MPFKFCRLTKGTYFQLFLGKEVLLGKCDVELYVQVALLHGIAVDGHTLSPHHFSRAYTAQQQYVTTTTANTHYLMLHYTQ